MFKNITVKLKRLGTQESSDEADIQSMNSTSSISFEKSRRSKYSNKFQCKKKLIEQITLETGCDDSLNSPKEKPKNVCFIQDSPFYIHRVASSEKLEEFKRLYYENPSRLYLKDHRKEWLPIHYAAAKSRIKIIEFILEKSGKNIINEQDQIGNTPLHIAIENGHLELCKFLLDKEADLTIKNKALHSPLHYCVVHSKPKILDALLSHRNCKDINLRGENAGTPLHYCAYYDDLECAKVLVKYNASLCRPCRQGFFPIHIAASRGSNRVLEFLFQEGAKTGCSKSRMLSFVDSDNNKPLHSAVQFGNIDAVKMCIEHGARIDDCVESDNSTPVHIACAQGSLDLLRLMFESQPDLVGVVIQMQDINLMTPLHKACMFDHVDVVAFLMEHGASLNVLDSEKRTPLLLAASRQSIQVICFLLNRNANIETKDSKMRNILHLIVTNQQNSTKNLSNDDTRECDSPLCEIIPNLLQRENYLNLLNESDINGCTVIHYVSKMGYVGDLKALIRFGANITVTNNERQSPLHFAAKYGRYNSCMLILSSGNYKNYINEKDNNGCTALHLAAENGHARVVKMLMQKGALMFKTLEGNNPFHLAAMNGHTSCMNIIYSIDSHVIDSKNKNNDTALHLAAQNGHQNVVQFLLDSGASFTKNCNEHTFIDLAIRCKQQSVLLTIINHDRWIEALDLSSKLYKAPFLGIIELSSEVTTAVLERCITKTYTDGENGKQHAITYKFTYLNWTEEIEDENGKMQLTPMLPLQLMVKYGRTDCLSHPLCEKLLHRKWDRYGLMLNGLTIAGYVLFLAMLTFIVLTFPSCLHDDVYEQLLNDTTSNCNNLFIDKRLAFEKYKKLHLYEIMATFCIIYSLAQIAKEIHQIRLLGVQHLTCFHTAAQIILYPCTIVFVTPFLFRNSIMNHYQWETGAITIFFAWFNLLLYMQRFYLFGIYVVMFTEILRTLFRVLILFSILIVGFGIVFYILLQDEASKSFSTPTIALFRTVVMMLGETESLNTYIVPFTDNSPFTLHYGNITIVFVTLFILLIPILLTNLLIGLAVGDIEVVQRNAKLKRDAMQIQLHVSFESQLPKRILKKITEDEYTVLIDCRADQKSYFNRICKTFKSTHYNKETLSSPNEYDLLYLELLKHKQKLFSMKSMMDQQTELIKLVVQKLEIKTEENDKDTSLASPTVMKRMQEALPVNISNNRLKNLVIKQLMVRTDGSLDEYQAL